MVMKLVFHVLTGVIFGCLFTSEVHGQSGQAGFGLRLSPDGIGITAKIFKNKNLAFGGQLNSGGMFMDEGKSYHAVGLAEYHLPLEDESWRVFFGGGLHAGVWQHGKGYYKDGEFRSGNETIFGIDGIGGVEYRFKNAPLSLSADFKPAINIFQTVDFFPHNMFGFSVRYYIR
jgi:hypothetical protein